MARFLHLSDLHLGPTDPKQTLGDYKEDMIPDKERMTRIKKMENTLSQLGLRLKQDNQKLDAILVSGDITLASCADGFTLFENFLKKLGSALPEKENIVVVPGNHDVSWYTKPSSVERYALFSKYIRASGYTTPLLDGIDESIDFSISSNIERHVLIDKERKWAVIPVNSANYCGSLINNEITDDEWIKIKSVLDGKKMTQASKGLNKLRLRDMPRITPWQFERLSDIIRHLNTLAPDYSMQKIVVLHHQLLPVSEIEEIKPYESIINLGLLRSFLANHKIGIVLHGHKHVDKIYRDAIALPGTSERSHSVLVVSGGTIGMNAAANNACRLIKLNTKYNSAPKVSIDFLPGLESGLQLQMPLEKSKEYPLWDDGIGSSDDFNFKQIFGNTVNETYERIQSIFENIEPSRHIALNCTIDSPTDAGTVPSCYPGISGVDDRAKWLRTVVDWWQLKRSVNDDKFHFTHGERIYNFQGKIDQIEKAIQTLKTSGAEGRAVISLLDPVEDFTHYDSRWPSFCLIQFVVSHGYPKKLDATAYFRHQEMKYWWVVNVAEIAKMQNLVCNGLQNDIKGLQQGSIRTISPMAHAGHSPIFVAVPEVDRLLDMDQKELWSMVYALVWLEIPFRENYLRKWLDLLNNLIPISNIDRMRAPASVRGLGFVIDTIQQFKKHHGNLFLGELETELNRVLSKNHQYFGEVLKGQVSKEFFNQWEAEVKHAIDKAILILSAILPNELEKASK